MGLIQSRTTRLILHSAQTQDMKNEKSVDRNILSEEATCKTVIDLKMGRKRSESFGIDYIVLQHSTKLFD
jgi:hypothetical protein